MVAANISLPSQPIAELCRRYNIRTLSLFGSVLRDDFRAESDVDVLFDPDPQSVITLLDVVAMRDELAAILHRRVDLVSRWSVEHGGSIARRDAILSSARVIYGS